MMYHYSTSAVAAAASSAPSIPSSCSTSAQTASTRCGVCYQPARPCDLHSHPQLLHRPSSTLLHRVLVCPTCIQRLSEWRPSERYPAGENCHLCGEGDPSCDEFACDRCTWKLCPTCIIAHYGYHAAERVQRLNPDAKFVCFECEGKEIQQQEEEKEVEESMIIDDEDDPFELPPSYAAIIGPRRHLATLDLLSPLSALHPHKFLNAFNLAQLVPGMTYHTMIHPAVRELMRLVESGGTVAHPPSEAMASIDSLMQYAGPGCVIGRDPCEDDEPTQSLDFPHEYLLTSTTMVTSAHLPRSLPAIPVELPPEYTNASRSFSSSAAASSSYSSAAASSSAAAAVASSSSTRKSPLLRIVSTCLYRLDRECDHDRGFHRQYNSNLKYVYGLLSVVREFPLIFPPHENWRLRIFWDKSLLTPCPCLECVGRRLIGQPELYPLPEAWQTIMSYLETLPFIQLRFYNFPSYQHSAPINISDPDMRGYHLGHVGTLTRFLTLADLGHTAELVVFSDLDGKWSMKFKKELDQMMKRKSACLRFHDVMYCTPLWGGACAFAYHPDTIAPLRFPGIEVTMHEFASWHMHYPTLLRDHPCMAMHHADHVREEQRKANLQAMQIDLKEKGIMKDGDEWSDAKIHAEYWKDLGQLPDEDSMKQQEAKKLLQERDAFAKEQKKVRADRLKKNMNAAVAAATTAAAAIKSSTSASSVSRTKRMSSKAFEEIKAERDGYFPYAADQAFLLYAVWNVIVEHERLMKVEMKRKPKNCIESKISHYEFIHTIWVRLPTPNMENLSLLGAQISPSDMKKRKNSPAFNSYLRDLQKGPSESQFLDYVKKYIQGMKKERCGGGEGGLKKVKNATAVVTGKRKLFLPNEQQMHSTLDEIERRIQKLTEVQKNKQIEVDEENEVDEEEEVHLAVKENNDEEEYHDENEEKADDDDDKVMKQAIPHLRKRRKLAHRNDEEEKQANCATHPARGSVIRGSPMSIDDELSSTTISASPPSVISSSYSYSSRHSADNPEHKSNINPHPTMVIDLVDDDDDEKEEDENDGGMVQVDGESDTSALCDGLRLWTSRELDLLRELGDNQLSAMEWLHLVNQHFPDRTVESTKARWRRLFASRRNLSLRICRTWTLVDDAKISTFTPHSLIKTKNENTAEEHANVVIEEGAEEQEEEDDEEEDSVERAQDNGDNESTTCNFLPLWNANDSDLLNDLIGGGFLLKSTWKQLAATHFPGRTVSSLRAQWNRLESDVKPSNYPPRTFLKWTDEDDSILRAFTPPTLAKKGSMACSDLSLWSESDTTLLTELMNSGIRSKSTWKQLANTYFFGRTGDAVRSRWVRLSQPRTWTKWTKPQDAPLGASLFLDPQHFKSIASQLERPPQACMRRYILLKANHNHTRKEEDGQADSVLLIEEDESKEMEEAKAMEDDNAPAVSHSPPARPSDDHTYSTRFQTFLQSTVDNTTSRQNTKSSSAAPSPSVSPSPVPSVESLSPSPLPLPLLLMIASHILTETPLAAAASSSASSSSSSFSSFLLQHSPPSPHAVAAASLAGSASSSPLPLATLSSGRSAIASSSSSVSCLTSITQPLRPDPPIASSPQQSPVRSIFAKPDVDGTVDDDDDDGDVDMTVVDPIHPPNKIEYVAATSATPPPLPPKPRPEMISIDDEDEDREDGDHNVDVNHHLYASAAKSSSTSMRDSIIDRLRMMSDDPAFVEYIIEHLQGEGPARKWLDTAELITANVVTLKSFFHELNSHHQTCLGRPYPDTDLAALRLHHLLNQ